MIIILCFSAGLPPNPYPTIGAIPPPPGYHRIAVKQGSFGAWLRHEPLKKDRTVRLFDGRPRLDQSGQFAVLDVSVGHSDLQQCADAVMRLRAEYLFSLGLYKSIEFRTSQNISLNFADWRKGERWKINGNRLIRYHACPIGIDSLSQRKAFDAYLQIVFTFCGTLSLEKQLMPVTHDRDLLIGDVLIRGGSPGHAMLVVDMAEDSAGHRVYILSQGFMPAQDIHIVKNLYDTTLSPWYTLDERPVYTPSWTFYPGQKRTWPEKRSL